MTQPGPNPDKQPLSDLSDEDAVVNEALDKATAQPFDDDQIPSWSPDDRGNEPAEPGDAPRDS